MEKVYCGHMAFCMGGLENFLRPGGEHFFCSCNHGRTYLWRYMAVFYVSLMAHLYMDGMALAGGRHDVPVQLQKIGCYRPGRDIPWQTAPYHGRDEMMRQAIRLLSS